MSGMPSPPAPDPMPFRIATVGPDEWSDLCRLFEGRGGPHYCWCMVWRDMPSADRRDKAAKKAELQRRVRTSVPVGLIGYLDDSPVAWCSVGPRSSFRKLAEGGVEDNETTWSITCFYVARSHRRRGLADRMITAAVDYARAYGADRIEAFPVQSDAPSYRFMGFVPQFERAGFRHAGSAGKWRQVMRLHLR